MASIEIRVDADLHLTLVHFETMNQKKFDEVDMLITDLLTKVKRPPTGVFGKRIIVGYAKKKRAIEVNSTYCQHLRKAIVDRLEVLGIAYTKGQWLAHVTDETDIFHEGHPIPFWEWMDFRWKELPLGEPVAYQLGILAE